MTTAKRAATRKGGGSRAAKAESNGKREFDFEGLALVLPPKLPSSFAYRFAKISGMESRKELVSGELYELLVKILGEDQYDKVCDHVDEIEAEVTLVDFLFRLLEEYGSAPGESQASASS